MDWKNLLHGDPVPWLLDADTPGVPYLALRDLLDCPPDNPDLAAAKHAAYQAGPIATVLANMQPDGYWVEPGPGYNPKYFSTVWSLILLAELGARLADDERIARACGYILDLALTSGGQFSASGAPSGTADCLQGNLCWALVTLGCTDPRLESAFDWMARTVTGEGIAPLEDKKAPVRYYAGKCGPGFDCGSNNKIPCAWGAAKVMRALAQVPPENRNGVVEPALSAGVDFLFSVDPATAAYPTGYSSKPNQGWWKFGFPVFYVTDILQIVDVLARLGYGQDPRLENSVRLVLGKQDRQGRWPLEYDYNGKTWFNFGEKKQPNKWVTLRVLRALKSYTMLCT